MTRTVTGLAMLGLVASLTACSAGATSTFAPTTPATPTNSVLSSLVDCTTVQSPSLLVDDWSLVEHPKGRSDSEREFDRQRMLQHFQLDARDWLHGLGSECTGVDELTQLNREATRLAGLVASGSATDADYEKLRESGNAWLDAVGYTDHRFGDDVSGDS